MLKQTFVKLIVVLIVMSFAGIAQGHDKIQNYFSDAACKVKVAVDPIQKRAILNNSLEQMADALNSVKGSPLISVDDKAGIAYYQGVLQEKQDELAGVNGYAPVADARLNAFADYVVQDMEQARETVTISLVAFLLIILIAVLIV